MMPMALQVNREAEFNRNMEWKNLGVSITTPSDEASKMFDATLSQYVFWKENDVVGGVHGSITAMLKADPEFVMGHVIKNGLELLGTGRTIRTDQSLKFDMENMCRLVAAESHLSGSEKSHVMALQLFADGEVSKATAVWETILLDQPLDALATKFAYDSYFYLGQSTQLRDTVARVLPHYSTDNPLYGHILGMYSFGLEETNLYDRAEKMANMALGINSGDAWSTHTLCHVMEMTGQPQEGITLLDKTVKDWEPCGLLACHNFWHWALYHIELGDYQSAMDILENQVMTRAANSGALLDIVDVNSLMFRLQMEGVNLGNRWQQALDMVSNHVDEHIMVFNDVHFMMACLGAENEHVTNRLMLSIQEFIAEGRGDSHVVMREIGETICKALVAYHDGDFASAVNLLHHIRYRLFAIGGSHAQRDLFNLFLIQAACRSPVREHHLIARSLLAERTAYKSCSPLSDRLMSRIPTLDDA